MGLKWDMSVKLRRDFLLRNTDLEKLNYQFAKSVTGVKIKSYVESNDTSLTVLSKTDKGGKAQTTIRLCIVDSRSGKLSTGLSCRGRRSYPIEYYPCGRSAIHGREHAVRPIH